MNFKKLLKVSTIVFIVTVFATCSQQEEINDPIACFSFDENRPDYGVGERVIFYNCSENAEIYSWDFGDGNFSNDKETSHAYSESGYYTIKLIAVNFYKTDSYEYSIFIDSEGGGGSLSVSTNPVTNITHESALSGGTITNITDEIIMAKGICWSVETLPDINDFTTTDGDGNNNYVSNLTYLEPATSYNVRAYIITEDTEIIYGNQVEFTTQDKEDPSPQGKNATIYKTNTPPVIDGVIDEIWNTIDNQEINVPHGGEAVSLNSPASWKGTWDDNFIYLLIEVPDDDFYPSAESGTLNWLSDKPEVYLDINAEKEDGLGPEDGFDTGHYQFAPAFEDNEYTDCEFAYTSTITNGDDSEYYFVEYAIPLYRLVDNNSEILDPNTRNSIGFDITVIDFDELDKGATNEVHQRINWANDVLDGKEESWANLDWSGNLIFEGGTAGLVANFKADKTNAILNETIQFTDLTNNSPTSWSWDFGDGTSSAEQNPAHSYTQTGTFTVKLTASNGSQTNTATKTNYITITDDNSSTLPQVNTIKPSEINETWASSGANVTNEGNSSVTEAGVCWSNTSNPTIENNRTVDGNGSGEFTSTITQISGNTTYYVRAYATNADGTAYGQEEIFTTTFAEPRVVDAYKAESAPIIDGQMDAIWNSAVTHSASISNHTVSLGKGATFKALWDNNFIYVIIDVPDDNHYPHYDAGVEAWMADRPQIYFDVNETLIDGSGPNTYGTGHHQIAPSFDFYSDDYLQFAYTVTDDAHYICEYAISYALLTDENGIVLNPGLRNKIGFEIEITDLDESGQGLNESVATTKWSNPGSTWENMDGCGLFNFVGAEPPTAIANFFEDFSTLNIDDNPALLDGWSIQNPQGNLAWLTKDYNGDKYISRHNYETGFADLESWVITPLLDFSSGNRGIVFEAAQAYWSHNNSTPLSAFISTDYNGTDMTSATWTKLDCKMPDQHSGFYTDVGSGKIDLSAYSGTGYIAFMYYGNSSERTTIALDDIEFGDYSLITSLPHINTADITNIQANSITCGGNVIDDGGETPSDFGICYSSEDTIPKIEHFTVTGSGYPTFSIDITGLSANTLYYIRSYATNSAGTAYGPIKTFTTNAEGTTGSITDIDGNTYTTVTIGTQEWMAENLKATKLPDGTNIPFITEDSQWGSLSGNDTDAAYCFYNNNANGEADTYGALYSYAAAKNACPTGWHLPTDADWDALISYIGSDGHGEVEGTALKSTTGWNNSGNGTDVYGFAALPGGYRYVTGGFYLSGSRGFWWSNTEFDATNSYYYFMRDDATFINKSNLTKSTGFSVRCIKD